MKPAASSKSAAGSAAVAVNAHPEPEGFIKTPIPKESEWLKKQYAKIQRLIGEIDFRALEYSDPLIATPQFFDDTVIISKMCTLSFPCYGDSISSPITDDFVHPAHKNLIMEFMSEDDNKLRNVVAETLQIILFSIYSEESGYSGTKSKNFITDFNEWYDTILDQSEKVRAAVVKGKVWHRRSGVHDGSKKLKPLVKVPMDGGGLKNRKSHKKTRRKRKSKNIKKKRRNKKKTKRTNKRRKKSKK